MTKEEEKAIERLEIHKEYAGLSNGVVFVNKKDIEIVLNMLKDLKRKNKTLTQTNRSYKGMIKKKDRQIDLMAEQLAGLTIWNNEKEEPLILRDKEEVKQYFERKVREWKKLRLENMQEQQMEL